MTEAGEHSTVAALGVPRMLPQTEVCPGYRIKNHKIDMQGVTMDDGL